MSEQVQNADVPVEIPASQVVDAPVQAPVVEQPEATQPKVEKTYTVSEVDKIIGKKKAEAYERGRRDLIDEYQRQKVGTDPAQAVPQQPPAQSQQAPVTQSPDVADVIRREIATQLTSHIEQVRQHDYTSRVKGEFLNKVQGGVERYGAEYEDFLLDLGLDKVNPQIIDVLNSIDNTAEVLQDFRQNEHKFTDLLGALREAPHLAYRKVRNLSTSIKNNQAGSQQRNANEPIAQIKPSVNPVGDNGSESKMSVKDFKKQAWLRK